MANKLEQIPTEALDLARSLRDTLVKTNDNTPLGKKFVDSEQAPFPANLFLLAGAWVLGAKLEVQIALETIPENEIFVTLYEKRVKIKVIAKTEKDSYAINIYPDGQIIKRRPVISKTPREFYFVNGQQCEIFIGQDESVTPEDLQLIANVTSHLKSRML